MREQLERVKQWKKGLCYHLSVSPSHCSVIVFRPALVNRGHQYLRQLGRCVFTFFLSLKRLTYNTLLDWQVAVRMTHSANVSVFMQRKLSKFDGSQVCAEMPFFKRQKADTGLSLDSCVCPSVWYFHLVIVPCFGLLSFPSVAWLL